MKKINFFTNEIIDNKSDGSFGRSTKKVRKTKNLNKIINDKFWARPHANLMKKFEKIVGVDLNDEKFTEKFLETQCIKITDGFLVHKDVYQQYLKVQENKIACGYIWFDITDLKENIIGLKNGQASTGDVKGRVTSFETRGVQILLDILEDAVFKKKSYDQFLNDEIESDYYEDYKIQVEDSKTVRTRENVLVPRSLIFDFPQLKRNTLGRLLNRTLTKRTFHASVSHEECLKKLTTNYNQQFFLLDCVMRFGKSFIYYEYLKREWIDKGKVGIHTVFCHDTKTVDGWLTKADIYYTGLVDCVELKKDKSFDFNQKVEKNTIVFISQQLLHSNKDVSNPNEVHSQPLQDLISLNVKCDNTFVDEVHQYFSPKWKSYFESITRCRIILASGTAAKVKLEYPDLFDEYNTHTDTLNDLKDRLFREFGINIITSIKRINVSDLGSEFVNMANLQSIDEKGKLANPAIGNKFCDAIFKGYRTSPMTPEQIDTNNPKHCPIYVDTVEFGKMIFQYLTNNPELNIVPIMVAGSSKERTVKSENELKKFIKKQNSDGKSTVMITCGSMIQGISVEEWKEMINLSVVGTYEMFYQFFGRGWEIDTTKMKGKEIQITMWDYNPHRTLKVAAQFVQSLAMTNGLDIPKAFQYFFQIHNIFDYVPEGNSFQEISTSAIESEIREFVDSQVLTRGCKARLVTNTRPEVMGDISDELLETFLNTQGLNSSNKKVKELKSYKNDINKQKTNHSKKSHDLDIPKIPKNIQDSWQSAIDGLSVYTERIPIVTEVMFRGGKLKTKNVIELMSKSQDESFITGFGFPNSKISQQFSDYIIKHGNKGKINNKVDNSVNIIPVISECLNMNIDEFLNIGDVFDGIYRYGGDDTQLSVRDSYNIFKKELKSIKAKLGQKFVVQSAKSGSINLALTYLLYENSIKIFGKQLTKEQVIESVIYEDKNTFFESLINTMGFSKTTKSNKDFIIINPPYKDGLHLKIFLKAFEELNYGGTLICLHRETPAITKALNPKYKKETDDYRNIMLSNTSEITFIDGNSIFSDSNTNFFAPLIISKVVKDFNKSEIKINSNHFKNKFSYSVSTFDDVFIHSDIQKTIRIRDKVKSIIMKYDLSNLNEKSSKYNKSNYYVNIKQLGGNKPKNGKINKDFYCLISPKYENDLENQITQNLLDISKNGRGGGISVDSYQEALNLFSYLKTRFVRFVFSLTKIDQNIWDGDMLSVIPYLDFSKEWTDDMLFEYFELDGDLVDYIKEYIEPIYERDFN